jgi:hypothetical protein
VRLEGLGQFKKKKSNDIAWNRTRDLPACIIVPQPTTLICINTTFVSALSFGLASFDVEPIIYIPNLSVTQRIVA